MSLNVSFFVVHASSLLQKPRFDTVVLLTVSLSGGKCLNVYVTLFNTSTS